MATKTVQRPIYIDSRLHLVIEHIAKCNRFSGKKELDTINKILVSRLEIFCDMIEAAPEQIETFVKRTYALSVFNDENQHQLKKALGKSKNPYPLSLPLSTRDRFDKVCDLISQKIGFKISKTNLHNIVYLDYVISVRDQVKNNWVEFMEQPCFSPYVAETKEDDIDISISISKKDENLVNKNQDMESVEKTKKVKILAALDDLKDLLKD